MSLGSASNFFLGAASASGGSFELLKSVRFNPSDNAYLNRTPSSSGNQKTYTISFWTKLCDISSNTNYFLTAGSGSPGGLNSLEVGIDLNNRLFISEYGASLSDYFIETTTAYLRDPSGWYHFVIAVNTTESSATDRIKFYVNGVEQTKEATSYPFTLNRDTAVNSTTAHTIGSDGASDLNGYLADFYFIDGSAEEPSSFGSFDTNNVWRPKLYTGTYGTNGYHLFDFANESGIGDDSSGNDNDWTVNNLTDYSSSPNGSGSVTAGSPFSATYPWTTAFNGSISSVGAVGSAAGANDYVWTFANTLSGSTAAFVVNDTYVPDFDLGNKAAINGTALTSSDWTKTTNTLPVSSGSPGDYKVYTVSLGGSSLSSVGVGNAVRISAVLLDGVPLIFDIEGANDVLFDVPTNGTQNDTGAGGELSANYCTWNPLTIRNGGATPLQCVDGNLNFGDQGNTSSYGCCIGSIGVSSGKWYFEITYGSGSGVDNNCYCGILPLEQFVTNSGSNAFSLNTAALSIRGDAAYKGNGSSTAGYATGLTIGSTLGFAFDVDAGTMTCFLDGVSLGSFPYALEAGYTWVPFANDWSNSQPVSEFIINTGQRPWVATPPTDYKAICTANLPEATIPDGSNNFEAKTFTGTGAEQDITGLEFQPDLTIFGIRDNSRSRLLFDSHRTPTFYLQTNGASNPGQVEDTTTLTSFNSDGFTVGSSADVNRSTSPIISWNWKAGSSSSNTDGTISSTVRANASAGFSIVSWTGTGSAGTVGHGLGATPKLIIAKVYDSGYTDNWPVYHSAYGATQYTYLNTNLRATTYSDFWNDTEPTSSVFSVGTANSDNTKNLIAYCFAPVVGYSSFGTFYSNASADNQFVYTGFKPRFVLIKAYDASVSSLAEGSWGIRDSARQSYNPQGPSISLNTNSIESTSISMDFLSNGIKFRNGFGGNRDILYIAFAENPFSGNGGIAG